MTIVIPNFNTAKSVSGLNTYVYTVTSAAVHTCGISVEHRESSTMTISIVQAGSVNATLATMTLPGSTTTAGEPQSIATLKVAANCAIGDTISFVLTSSSAIDEQLNTVKALLNVHVGGLN
jgi:hypothetical protein